MWNAHTFLYDKICIHWKILHDFLFYPTQVFITEILPMDWFFIKRLKIHYLTPKFCSPNFPETSPITSTINTCVLYKSHMQPCNPGFRSNFLLTCALEYALFNWANFLHEMLNGYNYLFLEKYCQLWRNIVPF